VGRVWCRGPAVHLEADFTDAERLLMLADRHTRGVTYAQEWTLTLTAAHATLALAAATAVGTAGPNVHAWADVAATTKPEAPGPSPLTESGLGMGCNPWYRCPRPSLHIPSQAGLCQLPNGRSGHSVIKLAITPPYRGAATACAPELTLRKFAASACQIVLSTHTAKLPAWERGFARRT